MSKDDPLEPNRPGYRTGKVTLFLDREGMLEARENFWNAIIERDRPQYVGSEDLAQAKATWDIAWAAAIAAFSYLMEGRISP